MGVGPVLAPLQLARWNSPTTKRMMRNRGNGRGIIWETIARLDMRRGGAWEKSFAIKAETAPHAGRYAGRVGAKINIRITYFSWRTSQRLVNAVVIWSPRSMPRVFRELRFAAPSRSARHRTRNRPPYFVWVIFVKRFDSTVGRVTSERNLGREIIMSDISDDTKCPVFFINRVETFHINGWNLFGCKVKNTTDKSWKYYQVAIYISAYIVS